MAIAAGIATAIGSAAAAVGAVAASVGAGIAAAASAVGTFVAGLSATTIAAVGGIVGSIGTAAENILSSAQAAFPSISGIFSPLSTLVGDISKVLNSSIAKGVIGTFQTVDTVITSINHAIDTVKTGIEAFIKPISTFVGDAASLVNNIQTGLVKPVQELVGGVGTLVNGLKTDFDALIHQGIGGLGNFVTNLSDTLSSVDAQFGRAVQQMGLRNESTARDVLVPGLSEGIGGHIDRVGAALTATGFPTQGTFEPFQHVSGIGQDFYQLLKGKVDAALGAANATGGIAGALMSAEMWVVKTLYEIVGLLEVYSEGSRQQANADYPITLLDVGDLLKALTRGIIDNKEYLGELAQKGVNAKRAEVLFQNYFELIGPGEAIKAYWRGQIDQKQLTEALNKRAIDPSAQSVLTDIALELVNPREAMAAAGRVREGQAGFLPGSYGTEPPPEFVALYPRRLASPEIAKYDWIEHWRTPGIAWWITAYFRGLRTREEVQTAAAAENIPPDVIPDLIDIEAEVVQLWMIPDMIAADILTDAEALDYLHYIGLGDRDAKIILKYGDAKKKAPAAAQAADLQGISAANALTMYDDGIIDKQQYIEILELHKYSPQAAQLMADLGEQKQALAERKARATAIVDEVNLGSLTEADALSALYSLGYTQQEVVVYQTKIHAAKRSKTKYPSDAELKSFWKHGLITAEQYVASLQVNGWSLSWAQSFLALAEAGG